MSKGEVEIMNKYRSIVFTPLLLALAACVTINVYFPAAAAEKAADRIIKEVWEQKEQGQEKPEPSGSIDGDAPSKAAALFGMLLEQLIPPAHAEADINVSSAAIDRIKGAMHARHDRLVAYFNSGAIGLTRDGFISLRDAGSVPLKERGRLNQEIAAENSDRAAMYREIAQVNGHPEWEPEIRSTFARRWVSNARGGWWYEGGGGWQQK